MRPLYMLCLCLEYSDIRIRHRVRTYKEYCKFGGGLQLGRTPLLERKESLAGLAVLFCSVLSILEE
jgi:hypothetical protein